VFVPAGKLLPSLGSHRIVAMEQLSVAVTSHVTVPVHWPGSAGAVRVVGHESCGGTLSITTTVKEHVLVLPELSEAVHWTVLMPTGKLPSPGSQRNVGMEQLSVAFTVHVTVPVH
jgi:hypothetical protein